MRSLNGNKRSGLPAVLLALILLGWGATFAQQLDGNYFFNSITSQQGVELFEIDRQKDILRLDKGQFYYRLSAKGQLEAAGDFIRQEDLLVFVYTRPTDTIRRYRIETLTDSTLSFSENSVLYSFKRSTNEAVAGTVVPERGRMALSMVGSTVGVTAHSVWRGLLGMAFLLLLCFILSSKRRHINWKLVGSGIAMQLVIAVLVLKVPLVASIFDWASSKVVTFLEFSEKGAEFVFGRLVTDQDTFGYIFAFQVLPTIIFFSAFTSLLYYLGVLQFIVKGFAWVMSRTMHLSGAESLAAAANIFIGQTESPLMVKPYLDRMTKSEMLCLMVGGMATIAGGVLAAFIAFLGGDSDAEKILFTKHLLTASIMSAPAAIVIAKILYPETEQVERSLTISRDKIGSNILDAISRGTTQGLKLAVNVGAMLLVFTALITVINWIMVDMVGSLTGLNDKIIAASNGRYQGLSLQYLLGKLFAPVAWIIGVPAQDITIVGQLLGEKTILNEFYAYTTLSSLKTSGILTSYRSIVIATYALCGFANFASIGIQIGGIGVLAPSQRVTLSQFGIKALIGGTVAALLTATIAGMLIG